MIRCFWFDRLKSVNSLKCKKYCRIYTLEKTGGNPHYGREEHSIYGREETPYMARRTTAAVSDRFGESAVKGGAKVKEEELGV